MASSSLCTILIVVVKVRHYLWTNPYISRFNEDGKKAKSKGNHIWNIDAKKAPEGGWHFRPFRRKIAGSFPGVAYVGLKWQFHPRVWDPQASRTNLHVRFSSPSLPSWLSWNGDVLSGTPNSDTLSTELVVEARVSILFSALFRQLIIFSSCRKGKKLYLFKNTSSLLRPFPVTNPLRTWVLDVHLLLVTAGESATLWFLRPLRIS